MMCHLYLNAMTNVERGLEHPGVKRCLAQDRCPHRVWYIEAGGGMAGLKIQRI